MYFRRSMNRILKVRTLVNPVRFGSLYRCCQTGYVRPFSLSNYDGIRMNQTSCVISNSSRNFCSEDIKSNVKENDKSVEKSSSTGIEIERSARKSSNDGIDLMAPNFRNSYLFLKSNIKNRKQIGGKFHTMPKSLTLKLCRQPSKRLSTFQPNCGNTIAGQNDKKMETEKDHNCDAAMHHAIMKSKADICRHICNPNSLTYSSGTSALTTSAISSTETAAAGTPTDTSPLKTSAIPPTSATATSPDLKSTERIIDAKPSTSSETSAKTTSAISSTETAAVNTPTDTHLLKTSEIPPTTETTELTTSPDPKSAERIIDAKPSTSSETSAKTTSTIPSTETAAVSTPTDTHLLKTSEIPPTAETTELTTSPDPKSAERIIDAKPSTSSEPSAKTTSTIPSTETAAVSTPTDTHLLKTSEIPPTTETTETTELTTSPDPKSAERIIDAKPSTSSETSAKTTSTIPSTETAAVSTPTDTHLLKTSEIPPTTETTELTTSPDSKSAERIMDKLTDAEIEEICRTRCPCKDCHTPEEVNKSARVLDTKHSPGKSEKPSLTFKRALRRKNRINNRSSYIRTMVLPKNGQPPISFGNIPHDMRPESAMSNNLQHPLQMTPTSTQFNPIRTGNMYQQLPKISVKQQMRPIPYKGSSQLQSKYERMIRSQAKQSKQKFRPTSEGNSHPLPKPSYMPYIRFTGQTYHLDRMKPTPTRARPIYVKNYPSPADAKIVPRFDSRYTGVPYRSTSQSLGRRRQRSQQMPAVYGSPNRKNKQSLWDLQSSLPIWNLAPSKFPVSIVNSGHTHIGNGMALPRPNNILEQNLDKIKPQIVDAAERKKIITKLTGNLSVMIEGPTTLKLVTSGYPELRDEKDVIIQMEYVNLTDADKQHYLTGRYNRYSYATTAVGRTGSGTVLQIGKDVDNIKPGDKVFVKPVSCGKCPLCLSDRKNVCEYAAVSEMSPTQGTLNRLHVHSSEFITKIPENVSLLNAAMTWTLSSGIRACQKASVTAGDIVMVIGGGPLGIATGLAAQSMGATTVCLSDTRITFLEEARKVGINKVFLIDPKSPSQNTAIKIWEHIGDYSRLTFDCIGSQLTNQIAVDATKTGGKVIVMNNNESECALPIANIITRDIDIIISTIGNDDSELAALRFLSSGKVSIDKIMCSHYNMSNVIEAFQQLQSPNRLDSLVIVKCSTKDDTQDTKKKEKTK